MKRFHFSLQPVAVMRAHAEMQAREALASALAAQRQAEERLAASRARLAALESVIRTSRRESFRAADGAAYGAAHRREWSAELEAQKQVASARAAAEKRREACVEANRQLKVVVRLEEKARANHQLAWRHAEQGEIDEIAGQRAARRRISVS